MSYVLTWGTVTVRSANLCDVCVCSSSLEAGGSYNLRGSFL